MDNPAATLHCPNTRCQVSNPQSNKFCKKCRTPLLRRYLWAVGQGIDAYQPGDFIAGRYLLVQQQILLDTQPATPPDMPQEIPKGITPYLKLSPYGLHIPQVYGRLALMQGSRCLEIWLLEEAPLYSTTFLTGTEEADTLELLLPELKSVWKDASAVRQLNWLWQLANLWQPLSIEKVASSLLTPALLRVEGSLVRVLELQADTNPVPTLQQLGQLWSQQLLPDASPSIAEFIQQLCTQMIEGKLRTAEEIVTLLDQGLKDCGRSQSRTYQIFTDTDKGPSRNHNEDACYPTSGQLIRPSNEASALAIVCDGIGGHEGGEVASRLAIDTLRQQVEKLPANPGNWNPTLLAQELENATCVANDVISQQNDSEHRSDRQRMGTTLVMARTCAHEIYITHVGDSRVYWINRHNCHQVTQDDDLASREVRLGYALYRSAVQNPTAGSLVQALGMAPSAALHPTVQRFVLDEDCVFLLCSDGLSDNDRVEQYWQTEILPILDGQIDLRTAGARLIEIANTQNGHDNVTVALVYCNVTSSRESRSPQLSVSQLKSSSTPASGTVPVTVPNAAPSQMKTQQLTPPTPARRPWGLLLGILLLLGLGGVLAYVLIPDLSNLVDPWIKKIAFNSSPDSPPPPASPSSSPTPPSPTPSATTEEIVTESGLVQVTSSTIKNSDGKDAPLLLRRGLLPPQNQLAVGVVPAGSILQVIRKAPDQQQETWLQLKVCAPSLSNSKVQQPKSVKPSPVNSPNQGEKSPVKANSKPPIGSYRQVKQGDSGWIREADFVLVQNPNFTATPAQQSECKSETSSPTSTPTAKPSQSPKS